VVVTTVFSVCIANYTRRIWWHWCLCMSYWPLSHGARSLRTAWNPSIVMHILRCEKTGGFWMTPPRSASLQGSNHWLVDQWHRHRHRQFLARLNGNRLWSWFWTTVEIGGVSIKCINVKRQLGLNVNAGKFGIQSHFILYENILFLNGYFKISISNPRNESSVWLSDTHLCLSIWIFLINPLMIFLWAVSSFSMFL